MAITTTGCKTRPGRRFILDDDKPGKIAVQSMSDPARWWSDKKHILKAIKDAETDLAFWREMLEVLEAEAI